MHDNSPKFLFSIKATSSCHRTPPSNTSLLRLLLHHVIFLSISQSTLSILNCTACSTFLTKILKIKHPGFKLVIYYPTFPEFYYSQNVGGFYLIKMLHFLKIPRR